jgi:hypothetical protein
MTAAERRDELRVLECRRRHLPLMLMLAASIAAAPLPVLAGENPAVAEPAQPLRQSIERALASESTAVRHALPTTVVGPRGPAAGRPSFASRQQTDLGSPGFFRTPAGIITLAVLATGVGFAIYSTSHDRVKSPAR